jgi:four helix bundle protein
LPEDHEIKHLVIWSSSHLVISETAPPSVERELPSRIVMSELSEALKERSMSFAVSVLRLIDTLPRRPSADAIARQLAKCATSVAANYRSVCTARSRPDFISKLCIVVEEAEESVYWLEIMLRAGVATDQEIGPLRQEAIELRAIFSRSLGTARANSRIVSEMTR